MDPFSRLIRTMIPRPFRYFVWSLLDLFIALNLLAMLHSHRFTHFTSADGKRVRAEQLSMTGKIEAVLLGMENPKPVNRKFPEQPYETITLESNKKIECWSIRSEQSKGTVILFHGYGSKKSRTLDRSDEFIKMGYNTMLVDFQGSGGSEGNQTTIGYHEAEQVRTAFDYVKENGTGKIFLCGSSMGAVAIMKALNDYEIFPDGIMIECPFGTMYETVCARFRVMSVPEFPLAGLLVFWGGIQNNFWAFDHNPADYAANITCPTLLMYGEKDERVSRKEIDEIYRNINGPKTLKTFELAGHESYLRKYPTEWRETVEKFMDE